MADTSGRKGSVVIIGGGIIGVASAWYLQREGWQVTVVDRQTIGSACSHGNCGLVCPSHVLPLTEPGAFKVAIQSLLTPNSPFRIRPRLDPALWSWLWNFSRRCNHTHMIQSAYAIQALLTSAMREYENWVHAESIECEWQHKGLLFTYATQHELDAYEATNQLLASEFDEPARRLSASESVELEPALRDSVAGSWFYEHDAHLRPDRLLSSLRERLENQGCKFVENCDFRSFHGSSAYRGRDRNQPGPLPCRRLPAGMRCVDSPVAAALGL